MGERDHTSINAKGIEMKLRPYQEEALNSTLSKFESKHSLLCVMATGLGKTIYFSHIAERFRRHGRIMVVAHREELISQAQQKLEAITGERPDAEMAENYAHDWRFFKTDVVVATVQTLISGMDGEGRMTRFNQNEFSLLIIDEAHHAISKSYRRVIDYFRRNENLRVLGVTATPDRSDEVALGMIFEDVAYEYGILDGINDGWLVPIMQRAVFVKDLDLSGCRTTAGDLNGRDLENILMFEENLHGIATPTVELSGNRKTLLFTASVAQAERLSEIINRHKPGSAQYVCGQTPKEYRRRLIRDYAEGRFQYLCNVGVATEGFDDPSIEVVVMARPTKSRCLYTQMAGRGTRPLTGVVDGRETAEDRKNAILSSGKPSLEIIDFVGNSGRHKLVTSADILGGNYEDDVVDLAKKNVQEETRKGKPADMMNELRKAEAEIRARRRREEEAEARKHLIARAKYSTAKVNPFDVLDVMPWRERPWHKGRPPTQKQIEFLQRSGVDTEGLSFTHASQIIQQIIDRRKGGKCSFKQAQTLRRYGYDTAEMTFDEASRLLNRLKANGWKKLA